MRLTAALLADAATVAEGKLYVHGAGWDSINARTIPATHPSMAVALVFQIEYSEALKDIPFKVELLDEDDKPVGPRVEGQLRTGHAPTATVGAPSLAPLALPFQNVQFTAAGGYRFRITSGEEELASIAFRVQLLPKSGASAS